MFLPPRIHTKSLAGLCRRLALATKAGLADRSIWRDEAERGGRTQRAMLGAIRDALARGDSITAALATTGDYFPVLFRAMTEVGEISGNLDKTYKRLADHYERVLQAQRQMRSRLMWPLFQLGVAVAVVGVLIWIMGLLASKSADGTPPIDFLGLGLYGTRGLVIYLNFLTLVAIAAIAVYASARRGALWFRPLQRAALQTPIVGSALETLCLARLAWAMELAFDSSMDLRKAIPLVLDASGNDFYRRHTPDIARRIGQGASIAEAMAETSAFPSDLLQVVAAGEEAGTLVEALQHQANVYEERAGAAIGILAQLMGFLVWGGVAILIIVLIFRIFQSYLDSIQRLI